MKVMRLAVGCLLSLVVATAHASGVMSPESLQRYIAMLPELEALSERFPDYGDELELSQELQQHCDWQRHYDNTFMQQAPAEYQRELESILARHRLSPAEFTEISLKFSWASYQVMTPMFEMMQHMQQYLTEEERAEHAAQLKDMQHVQTVVDPCMGRAEKESVKAAVADIIQQVMQLEDDAQPEQPDW